MRLMMAFLILAIAVPACLWMLGVVGGDQANDMMGKVAGLVVIIGVAGGAIALVLGRGRRSTPDNSNKPGPKF